jgi:hypothetical protein
MLVMSVGNEIMVTPLTTDYVLWVSVFILFTKQMELTISLSPVFRLWHAK